MTAPNTPRATQARAKTMQKGTRESRGVRGYWGSTALSYGKLLFISRKSTPQHNSKKYTQYINQQHSRTPSLPSLTTCASLCVLRLCVAGAAGRLFTAPQTPGVTCCFTTSRGQPGHARGYLRHSALGTVHLPIAFWEHWASGVMWPGAAFHWVRA